MRLSSERMAPPPVESTIPQTPDSSVNAADSSSRNAASPLWEKIWGMESPAALTTSSSVSKNRCPVDHANLLPTEDFPHPINPTSTIFGSTISASHNPSCTRAFLTRIELIRHLVSLRQSSVSLLLNVGVMDKNILRLRPILHDEAEPFLVVEPLYSSCWHVGVIVKTTPQGSELRPVASTMPR